MGNIDVFDLKKMLLKNGIEGAILKHLCNESNNINSTRDVIKVALRLKDSLSFRWDIESAYSHCGISLSISERDRKASEAIDRFIGKLNYNRGRNHNDYKVDKDDLTLTIAYKMLDQILK